MLSIRIVTAGAVLAFAVSAAAAQDSDAPGQSVSLLQMLMHASETKTAPQAKLEAKRVSPKAIRMARHLHRHATRIAAETEDPASTGEPTPTTEQTPTPASWTAQAAIDAAPPSIWPAGNAATFAGVLDSEPQVASAAPSLSNDQNAATSNAAADTQPAPAAAVAQQDNSDDSRDAWFEEILATLGGALAAGAFAWFLMGGNAPRRMYR